MAAAKTGATMTSDGVDFVDENDAGGILLALLEQVANARRSDSDKHFNKVGTADREKRNIGLACDGPCQQGFPGTRRADQQHAFRNTATEFLELLGFFEEVDNFLQLFLRFIDTGNILERDFLLMRG